MPYVLGVDIGTSFTAAAIARIGEGHTVPAPQILSLGLRGGAVPSVIFLGDSGHVLVGDAAERRGANRPDRVVREFKRRVGDTVPVVVGDLRIAPEDIFATMARWVVDRAEEREGEPPDAVSLSHPASWGEYKLSLVRRALAGVGLADVTLLSEPEAAALHYASQERVSADCTIAVYDLGGGTFDIALLKKTSSGSFEAFGGAGGIERLGGADFDEAVFAHVAASAGDAFTQLDTTDPGVLVALARVRRECVEAKEALSFDSEASIPVLLPGAQTQVRLVRSEFERMIEAPVRETIDALRSAIESTSVAVTDVAAILLIGGSSRIPLVAELLSEELNRPIAIDADPKASISLGAAFAAASALAAVMDVEDDEDRDDDENDPAVPAPQRIRFGSRVAPLAAAAVAALVLTGAVFQTSSLNSLIADAGDGSEFSDAPLPEFPTGESTDSGSLFGPKATAPRASEPIPTEPEPPSARSRGQDASPIRTTPPSSKSPAKPKSNASASAPVLTAEGTEPVPQPSSDPMPVPDPDPTTAPVPVPDPTTDPVPVPEPDPTTDPVPDPDPTTDPVPVPDPDPTADPVPDPEPEPDPITPPAEDPAPEPAPVEPTEPVDPVLP